MKKILITLSLMLVVTASALKREVKIKKPNGVLPDITVVKENGRATWNIYKSERSDRVSLYGLNIHHANKLLQAANRAQAFYKEIAGSGRCPNSKVKSGSFGEIQEYKKGDSISFEVVCSKNKIQLEIMMTDEYVIDFLIIRTEPAHLKLLSQRLITELKKK